MKIWITVKIDYNYTYTNNGQKNIQYHLSQHQGYNLNA